MGETYNIQNINLHLSDPHEFSGEWIGQMDILKQVLACWLSVNEADLPLTPRLVGPPGIGKPRLRFRPPKLAIRSCTFTNVPPTHGQKIYWLPRCWPRVEKLPTMVRRL